MKREWLFNYSKGRLLVGPGCRVKKNRDGSGTITGAMIQRMPGIGGIKIECYCSGEVDSGCEIQIQSGPLTTVKCVNDYCEGTCSKPTIIPKFKFVRSKNSKKNWLFRFTEKGVRLNPKCKCRKNRDGSVTVTGALIQRMGGIGGITIYCSCKGSKGICGTKIIINGSSSEITCTKGSCSGSCGMLIIPDFLPVRSISSSKSQSKKRPK